MKKYTLNHFKKEDWIDESSREVKDPNHEDYEWGSDPDQASFKTYDKLVDYILMRCKNASVVYLFVKEDKEPFITSNITLLEWAIRHTPLINEGGNYYLQEYLSYEDAYAVAKDMMEEHELCYNETSRDYLSKLPLIDAANKD